MASEWNFYGTFPVAPLVDSFSLLSLSPKAPSLNGYFNTRRRPLPREVRELVEDKLGSQALAKESNLSECHQRAVGSSALRACPRVGQSVGPGSGCGTGGREGRRGKRAYRLRIGSWNIGSLTSKSIGLAKILQKRKINIACVQETRWVRSRARNADGYKLWYSGVHRGKNEVGILVDSHLRESVVEVRRVNDRLMTIKLVVGECTLNVVSAYAPQVGLDEEIKMHFWEGLDDIVRSIPPSERLFIGGNFNGHIGSSVGGYTEVHGGFGFGERNGGGTSLLDFAKAFDLVIANSSFLKREEHLAFGDGHWYYDKEEEEWWNAGVQGKVEAKKAAYLRLVGSTGEEEKTANRERYMVARKKAKMAVTEAKATTFARLGNDSSDELIEKTVELEKADEARMAVLARMAASEEVIRVLRCGQAIRPFCYQFGKAVLEGFGRAGIHRTRVTTSRSRLGIFAVFVP
uniref:Craniofacial development protein 2-like n=1 Tax=Nicotiana tabacum TaxID=4097 RepID=A0A1S4CT90_TOBAC|nr:PREDICTED: craniofacial development protein 2-like [Nicotiana tabacum]